MPENLISAYLMNRCGVPFDQERLVELCKAEERMVIQDAVIRVFSSMAKTGVVPADIRTFVLVESDVFAWPWSRFNEIYDQFAPNSLAADNYKLAFDLYTVLSASPVNFERAVELHYKIRDARSRGDL